VALDVYVGSLTRYYTRDWENVVQQQARIEGYQYTQITPDGPLDQQRRPTVDEVQPAIRAWQEALTRGLGSHLDEPLNWDESPGAPYFTDRPGYPGYSGLLLWASYADKPGVDRPSQLPEDGWYSDPVFTAAIEKESKTPYRQILQPEIWLPCRFDFCFQGPSPVDQPAWIGSSIALLKQVEALNAATFRASEPELASYLKEEFEAASELEHAAKFTLAVFLELARKSVEHRVPMLLSC
jgi:hypothetical protein